jgi:hypothetical protein
MPIRMICMANSWREHGRCVAGIRPSNGDWVRPVPVGGGPFEHDDTLVDGRPIEPLDLVQLRVRQPNTVTRFQIENREIVDGDWEVVGSVDVSDVMQYCSNSSTVLHSRGKVVEPAVMERLPEDQWTSLQLVHATNVQFVPDERKENRWVAEFSLSPFGPAYHIGISDPVVTNRLNEGDTIGRDCLLTVSLTEPVAFPQWNMPELCYKIVAAVIEV